MKSTTFPFFKSKSMPPTESRQMFYSTNNRHMYTLQFSTKWCVIQWLILAFILKHPYILNDFWWTYFFFSNEYLFPTSLINISFNIPAFNNVIFSWNLLLKKFLFTNFVKYFAKEKYLNDKFGKRREILFLNNLFTNVLSVDFYFHVFTIP